MLIASPTATSLRHHEPFAWLDKIVEQLASSVVVDQGANRNRNLDRHAVTARAIAALAVAPTLGFVLGIEPEMEEGVVMYARYQDDVPTAASVAAAGPAARDELLAPEGHAAVAAVASLHPDSCLVNEHQQLAISN